MSTYEARLSALREQMAKDGLDGFVVPICDEHMSEYVGDYAQRLAWLTGFGGSAGSAVVLKDKAAIFVDGRYTIQVRDQVDGKLYEYVGTADHSLIDWLGNNAPEGATIGYDAWLHTQDWAKSASAKLQKAGAKLMAVQTNPIDAVWEDQPEPSLAKLDVQPDEFAGKSSADKRADIADWLMDEGLDATVIAALDSVAWAFNIRGQDISNTPVPRGYAIVKKDGSAELFVAPEKLTDDVRVHLGNAVSLRDYAEFETALSEYRGQKVGVDPERSVSAIFEQLENAGATIIKKRDPTILAKAIKNETEINGHKAAQARDGAALTRFLHWFSENALNDQDELSVAAKLAEFRGQSDKLRDLSFRTISGAGPNGALCHYSVNEETNRKIETGTLYLVDSGGQYRDGTTDVTRTMAVGEPTPEMIKRYTQVLQGHIALAKAVFPKGTVGGQLDILARQYLWADGVDYAHGTGHGVGAYLSVHEGPQRIAAFGGFGEPLVAGMICSNEPGYYKTDAFGIRIENLILVEKREINGAEQDMLGFETLTYAPLDRRLIDVAMLSDAQRQWVDDYHTKVLEIVGPQIEGAALNWLKEQCKAL
ncbi:aminopeptidase P family protein [Parasphingorhabdus halotolerans]|uniref:Aminopeptidase P family protein n=1 Tax=Parasphingorhabdus halotolerans TaxID=2725558 RepID=A0A6H2DRA1_9SPHN|nr:aminopeptidase P family protein [Parasphingorhabdus halotolerans]QJB70864.1 aminopeptidase P family protein [Parasphingorhabdus halotolerans]